MHHVEDMQMLIGLKLVNKTFYIDYYQITKHSNTQLFLMSDNIIN